jgi:hypothetical protein
MLKITTVDGGSQKTLVLEGQLTGPWVDEFKKSWDAIRGEFDPGQVVIDLQGVTVISAAGEEALVEVMRQGTNFVSGGVYTGHVVRDLASRHRFRCPKSWFSHRK